jgi:hypothetical protein
VQGVRRSLVMFAVLAGCSQGGFGDPIENPSGSCGTRPAEARAGYSAPARGEVWVPDCANALEREYWRVSTVDGVHGYMLPRPDGEPYLQPACEAPQHALAAVVERYGLCASASSAEGVDVINAMALPDALAVGHYLHGQLRFAVVEGTIGIVPYPLPSDIVDACRLGDQPNPVELEEMCARERDRLRSGHDIGFGYSGPGAVALVARLNQLYGVP